MVDDPFERAVARESRLRRQAARFDSPAGMMRVMTWWFVAVAVGWALLLAVHWSLLPDPRWLAVLHTVAFGLTVGYWVIVMGFIRWMARRRPDFFGGES